MGVRRRAATDGQLASLLEQARLDTLTYGLPSGSPGDGTPVGMHRRHWDTALSGADPFTAAVAALHAWEVHRGAGLVLAADGPLAVGTNVAFSAPLPIGYVDGACRIVTVIDDAHRFGFTYGTLSVHPECGEESFAVTRDSDGVVRFEIDAVSRPVQPLARLVPVVADWLQDAAVRRYLAAMRRAVAAGY
jgi:uncharacterized protein (UPF0548 family)